MPHDHPYRICFVCSGNICRSPMAESVMRSMAAQQGLTGVVVDSAGTGDWHIGERADLRALSVLAGAGYEGTMHRARQFDPAWFGDRELVVALDRGHARTLRAWAPDEPARAKVRLLRSFDPAAREGDHDVADPYYEGEQAFSTVLEQIVAACGGLVERVRSALGEAGPGHGLDTVNAVAAEAVAVQLDRPVSSGDRR